MQVGWELWAYVNDYVNKDGEVDSPKGVPVILQPENCDRWPTGEDAVKFQEPFPSQLMVIV